MIGKLQISQTTARVPSKHSGSSPFQPEEQGSTGKLPTSYEWERGRGASPAPAPAWDTAPGSQPPRGGPGRVPWPPVPVGARQRGSPTKTSTREAAGSRQERGSCPERGQGHRGEPGPRQPRSTSSRPARAASARLLSLLWGGRRARPRPESGFRLGPGASLASGWSKDRLGKPGSGTRLCLQPRALPARISPRLRSWPFLAAGDGPRPQPGRAPARHRWREPPTLPGESGCFWPGSRNADSGSFPGNLLRLLPRPRGPVPRRWPNSEPQDPPAPSRVGLLSCGCQWRSFTASSGELGRATVPSPVPSPQLRTGTGTDRPVQVPQPPAASDGPARGAQLGFTGGEQGPDPLPKRSQVIPRAETSLLSLGAAAASDQGWERRTRRAPLRGPPDPERRAAIC